MFKITLESTWTHNGITRNWIKYLKVNEIEEVFNFYKLDDILEIKNANTSLTRTPKDNIIEFKIKTLCTT